MPDMPVLEEADGPAAPSGQRQVRFEEGWRDVPVHDRAGLRPGHAITGPAVIEEAASVTILRPGYHLAIDRFGNLIITAQRA